ncbi:hypothetical protein ACKUB1_18525 [Methanospirillum stamsii]|uniref:Uncharacterized protein n=1 Tax=Methanospirillum stamsii TaxID=1277351 RepID=A0A2V2N757_9EURY|nr:hypothetical protein [Methanospirillum stamsii]PWR75894.1 hypothetical protein DLD82_02185 [Methanospirillum stamsii]
MKFVVTAEHPRPPVRYEKVGRLRPGENRSCEVILDGHGVIRNIQASDLLLVLNGLLVPDLELSESGNRIIISGRYVVLVKQVRVMIRDWPKKKAALFIREER